MTSVVPAVPGEIELRLKIQTKILAPLLTMRRPMMMMEEAAIFSPSTRSLNDRKDAKNPLRKSAGTVPSPNAAVMEKPTKGSWVVAAFTIMAQERPQGRNPTNRPSIILDAGSRERRRGEIRLPHRVPDSEKNRLSPRGRGKIFMSMAPRKINSPPPIRVMPPLTCASVPLRVRSLKEKRGSRSEAPIGDEPAAVKRQMVVTVPEEMGTAFRGVRPLQVEGVGQDQRAAHAQTVQASQKSDAEGLQRGRPFAFSVSYRTESLNRLQAP